MEATETRHKIFNFIRIEDQNCLCVTLFIFCISHSREQVKEIQEFS